MAQLVSGPLRVILAPEKVALQVELGFVAFHAVRLALQPRQSY